MGKEGGEGGQLTFVEGIKVWWGGYWGGIFVGRGHEQIFRWWDHSVHAPFCRGGGGVEPLTKFSKRGA